MEVSSLLFTSKFIPCKLTVNKEFKCRYKLCQMYLQFVSLRYLRADHAHSDPNEAQQCGGAHGDDLDG